MTNLCAWEAITQYASWFAEAQEGALNIGPERLHKISDCMKNSILLIKPSNMWDCYKTRQIAVILHQ